MGHLFAATQYVELTVVDIDDAASAVDQPPVMIPLIKLELSSIELAG